MNSKSALPPTDSLPARTFVQAAIASMVTAPKPSISKMIRYEANLILSVDSKPFQIDSPVYVGAAEAAIIKPETRHIVHADERRIVRFAFHPIHPRFRTIVDHVQPAVKILSRPAFSHIDDTIHQAYYNGLDSDTANRAIDAALAVVLSDLPPPKPMDPRILAALRTIDANIDTPFEQMARDCGLSVSRFSHLFTQEVGLSYRNLLRWGRLRLAWELVAWRQDLSLTQIAHLMGFADSSHLSRAFNRGLGMTPSMIRDGGRIEVVGRKMPAGHHIPPDDVMRGGS